LIDLPSFSSVDWGDFPTWLGATGTLLALLAAGIATRAAWHVLEVERQRDVDRRTAEERAQAERVAGWVIVDEETGDLTIHVHNGSSQPVYDVVTVVRDLDDLDFSIDSVNFLPVAPPTTTTTLTLTYEGEGTELQRINRRLYLTFRDGRARTWERDTHGRLRRAHRPADEAPEPGPTGRIEAAFSDNRPLWNVTEYPESSN
jgi:hypothetical protein